jgi:hypothetical protein
MEKMNIKRSQLKRIWEVDCLSLDAALAGSFEWRELANYVPDFSKIFNPELPEEVIEFQLQLFIHSRSHDANKISLRLENALNDLHAEKMNVVSRLSTQEVNRLIFQIKFSEAKGLGGLFWAIGTDPREEFACISRRLHQRFQMVAMRQAIKI